MPPSPDHSGPETGPPESELMRENRELRAEVARLSEELSRRQLERTELQQVVHELTELSLRDALTGLYNRRGLDERLIEEVARARRYGAPLSLILIDIDHFKRVNDTYGHAVGDLAITHVARVLTKHRRVSDIAARYGGEELVLLLPHTPLEGALNVAERLRQQIEASVYRAGEVDDRLTVSLGVAVHELNMREPSELLEAADRALYRSKRTGRNRVSIAEPL